MGYMIEITEHKLDEMSECVEEMLRMGGRLMHCLDSMSEKGRGRMGFRGDEDYRNRGRMGWRDDDYDEEERMGERRGVPGSGRRYR